MKKNLTELVFIVDRSGSMGGLPGFALAARTIVHVVGPVWQGGGHLGAPASSPVYT